MVYSGPLAEINKRLIFAPRRVWLLIQKPETNKMWTSPCLLVMLCKFVFTHCKNNKFLTKIIMFWNWHSKTSYNTATTVLSSGKRKEFMLSFCSVESMFFDVTYLHGLLGVSWKHHCINVPITFLGSRNLWVFSYARTADLF